MAAADQPKSKEEWFVSLEEAIMESEDGQNKRRQHKIQRVAEVLRKKNEGCFEPIAVSIGPYHRKKPDLEPMEKLKAPLMGKYVKAQDGPKEWQLYHEVEKVAAEARQCYAEDDTTKEMNDDEFTRMMFLDGCFFLQFIKDRGEGIQMISLVDRACVTRDLFLLENQLPFIVLKALSRSSDPVEMMMNFIDKWPHPEPKEEQPSRPSKTEGEPIHLLELLRRSLLNPKDVQGKQSGGGGKGRGEGVGFRPHTYRSATALKKVGIHFRKSQSHRFTDVGFRKNLGLLRIQGELRLPPMFVDDDTKSCLLNLVAYENMCADVPAEHAVVTSYVCFLDNMIDSAEDVTELRSHGILINNLGSDKQVAELFNEISKDLVPNPEVYASVNQQIEKHYKNKFKRWVLERLYTHFKAPWSRLSFVAALIILLLTFIQAFYAIKQGIKD